MTSLKWLSQDPSGYLCRVLSALWLGNATDLLAHVLMWDENMDSLDTNAWEVLMQRGGWDERQQQQYTESKQRELPRF